MNFPVWDDVKDFINGCHNEWWKRYKEVTLKDAVIPINGLGANASTDSNGNVTFPIWQNRIGREASIARVIISADGFTPADPSTDGYAYLFIGEQFGGLYHDFVPNAPGEQTFPNVAEYGRHQGIQLHKNDVLSLHVVGGPASTNLSAFVWGFAYPERGSEKAII